MELANMQSDVSFIGEPDALAKLFGALSAARAFFEPVTKDTAGQHMAGKYKYAPLSNLVAATAQALSAQGVFVLQTLTTPAGLFTGGVDPIPMHRLTTIVAGHGARIESRFDFCPAGGSEGDDIKEYGKQTTYLRRYAYNAFFILDGEDDADAHAQPTRGGTQQPRQEQRKAPEAPKPAARQAPTNNAASQGNSAVPAASNPPVQQRSLPAGYEAVPSSKDRFPPLPKEDESVARIREAAKEDGRREAAAASAKVAAPQAPLVDESPLDLGEPADAPDESEVVTEVTDEQNAQLRGLLKGLGYKGSAVPSLLVRMVGPNVTTDNIDSRSARTFIQALQFEASERGIQV